MTKATFFKLAILIFLAFIVCLPEFFPSETALQIHFLCSTFDSCEALNWCLPADGEISKTHCNASEEASKNATSRQDKAVEDWFMCQTQDDLESLIYNASGSGTDVRVVLSLQITDLPLKEVTVPAFFNHSKCNIETRHNITLYNCCKNKTELKKDMTNPVSYPPIKESAIDLRHQLNRSYWILHFQDISEMPVISVRWWSVSAIVWSIMVFAVLFLVFLSIGVQVQNYCQKKKMLVPANIHQPIRFSKRRVKSLGDLPNSLTLFSTEDEEVYFEKIPASRTGESYFRMFEETYIIRLSPIYELSLTDVSDVSGEDAEDVAADEGRKVTLDMPTTPASTHSDHFTFLHHRCHPSTGN